MFMVCTLHTLGQGGILYATPMTSVRYKLYWLIEVVAYCAVDGFALISGYIANNRPQKYSKIVEMWFQALFYSFILTLFFVLVGKSTIDMNGLLHTAFPVTFVSFWYFSAYFALFFAMPVLNKFLFSLDESTAKKVLIITFSLFSVIGAINDPFMLGKGYSAIWLMVLYCVGFLAKKTHLFEKKSSGWLISLLAVCILVTWGLYVFYGKERLFSYISPTILLSAMALVILFSRLRPNPKLVKLFSPLAFGVYLFHQNTVIWNDFLKDGFVYVASMNIVNGTVHIIGYAFMIFCSGLIVEFIRSRLARLLKIPYISQKIIDFFNVSITKLSRLIK